LSVDLGKITARQRKAWSTGDFHRIGVAQVVVGEMLARSLHVHPGERCWMSPAVRATPRSLRLVAALR
jgi:ABC-type lipoprotein release transport system permease subunit